MRVRLHPCSPLTSAAQLVFNITAFLHDPPMADSNFLLCPSLYGELLLTRWSSAWVLAQVSKALRGDGSVGRRLCLLSQRLF